MPGGPPRTPRATLDRARTLRESGATWAEVADRLNADRITTATGLRWNEERAREMVVRAAEREGRPLVTPPRRPAGAAVPGKQRTSWCVRCPGETYVPSRKFGEHIRDAHPETWAVVVQALDKAAEREDFDGRTDLVDGVRGTTGPGVPYVDRRGWAA